MATTRPRTGVIVGSNRRESINRRLALALAQARRGPFRLRVDPHRRPADVQPGSRGQPARHGEALHRRGRATCRPLLFVTPEHNRSLPAVLKNAIDWGSKPNDKNVWRGRIAAITGTSFGVIGTAVGQQHLRQILGILGMTVMGGEAYISFKPDPVDHDGNFLDESKRAFCQAYMDQFVDLVVKLAPAQR